MGIFFQVDVDFGVLQFFNTYKPSILKMGYHNDSNVLITT